MIHDDDAADDEQSQQLKKVTLFEHDVTVTLRKASTILHFLQMLSRHV